MTTPETISTYFTVRTEPQNQFLDKLLGPKYKVSRSGNPTAVFVRTHKGPDTALERGRRRIVKGTHPSHGILGGNNLPHPI